MGRKVITLDSVSFRHECTRLEAIVTESGFIPDLILSIRTGGLYVGEKMFADVRHESVTLQRPSTKAKRAPVKKIIRLLPRPVLDLLRIAESWWLENKKHTKQPASFILPPMQDAQNILIVDDAVDSGATLLAVVEAVRTDMPGAEVRSAVITQTTLSPMITPDYTLYNNRTLIRFPWSMDA